MRSSKYILLSCALLFAACSDDPQIGSELSSSDHTGLVTDPVVVEESTLRKFYKVDVSDGDTVTLFDRPTEQSQSMGSLLKGATVEVTGRRTENWLEIFVGEMDGWVKETELTPLKARTAVIQEDLGTKVDLQWSVDLPDWRDLSLYSAPSFSEDSFATIPNGSDVRVVRVLRPGWMYVVHDDLSGWGFSPYSPNSSGELVSNKGYEQNLPSNSDSSFEADGSAQSDYCGPSDLVSVELPKDYSLVDMSILEQSDARRQKFECSRWASQDYFFMVDLVDFMNSPTWLILEIEGSASDRQMLMEQIVGPRRVALKLVEKYSSWSPEDILEQTKLDLPFVQFQDGSNEAVLEIARHGLTHSEAEKRDAARDQFLKRCQADLRNVPPSKRPEEPYKTCAAHWLNEAT